MAGITDETNPDAIAAFRETTGATYPILMGVSDETKEAYDVTRAPSVRVVDKDGKRAGDDMEALEAALAH